MDWHLTWQDPVALGLALACLGLAWWLARRFGKRGGCAGCATGQPTATSGEPAAVPLDRLTISRARLPDRDLSQR